MDLLDQLVDNIGNNLNIDDIKILNIIAYDNYTILDEEGNILDKYNIIISKNQKLYLEISDHSIILNNKIEIIPKNEILYYSLIDDIISFLEILENTTPPKFSNFENLKNESLTFIEALKNY